MLDNPTDLYLMTVIGTMLLALLVATIVILIFIYQNRQMKSQIEIKRIKINSEKELLKTQLDIREQTLKNISEELHDNVGQILSLANLTLTSINLPNDNAAQKDLDDTMELISKAIVDLRNLSKTLDPETIQKTSLPNMLQFELDRLKRIGKYKTQLLIFGTERSLEAMQQLIAYRISQEALSNIIKHSKANQINIIFRYEDNLLDLSIQDNGIGLPHTDKPTEQLTTGSGLTNMKNRANFINSQFRIARLPDTGTEVSLRIPITTY